jgi:hypothetical protein
MSTRQALADVAAALPVAPKGQGKRPHEIHDAVGKWGRSTIRHALRDLVDEGIAEFDGPDGGRLYRKASEQTA